MIDKDKTLPRLTYQEIDRLVDPDRACVIQLGRLGLEELEMVAQAQRDADWERMKPLIKALVRVWEHVAELREAWQRGVLTECDGQGGTRSNRNAERETELRKLGCDHDSR